MKTLSIFILVSLFLLTGCAAPRLYDHKADMSNYARDHYECVQEARTGGGGSGLAGVAAIQTMKKHHRELYKWCMEARGYTVSTTQEPGAVEADLLYR